MKLLITTQSIDLDDPALGFFHRWVEAFAERFESIEVICLKEGRHTLPGNVRIHSLGKERGRANRAIYAIRFLRLAWRLRRDYGAVFVHMNPEYVVLAGPFWRVYGKRIVLWYTHRSVTWKLRVAVWLAHAVATAAPESLRIRSANVHVVGHGIDTAAFETPRDGSFGEPLRLVSVGRITPIKRLELLLDAVAELRTQEVPIRLALVGAPAMPADRAYEADLKSRASALGIEDIVSFAGSIPYERMPELYRDTDASVNLAPTGGIDKAVLESMASGCIPLVANRAFAPFFGPDADRLLFVPDAHDLVRHIRSIERLSRAERRALSGRLVQAARMRADVKGVVERIAGLLR